MASSPCSAFRSSPPSATLGRCLIWRLLQPWYVARRSVNPNKSEKNRCQVYASVLASLNAGTSAKNGLLYSLHLSLVTFSILAVYAYRDVWPLMTIPLRPKDEAEGNILWVKIALLAFVGVFLPLFEPYPYIPYDPEVSALRVRNKLAAQNSMISASHGPRKPRTDGIASLLPDVCLAGSRDLPRIPGQALAARRAPPIMRLR